jgi:ATP-binding cassette subfamily B protein
MGRGMVLGGAKARDFKGTIRKLLGYLKPYWVSMAFAVVVAMASTIFAVLGPKILGMATTKLFEGVVGLMTGNGPGIDFVYIGKICLLLVGLYLLASTFSYIQGWIMAGIAMKVTYSFRKDISEKINRMPLKYFDTTSHGEVLSRVTNDVETVSQTLNQSLSQIVTSVTTVVGITIMMLSISWILSLVAFVIVPLSFFAMGLVIKQSQKYFKDQQVYLGHANGHIEEMYTGHLVVKAINGEAQSIEKFDEYNNTLYNTAWKSQFFSGLMFPIMSFIGNLGYVAVAIIGGALVIQGKIPIGDIQAFIQYVRQFTQPITQIAQASNIFQQTAAAAEHVFEFLDEPEEVPDSATPVKLTKVEGNVEFDHVHFGYNPDKIIINDFSVDVKAGQRIAIVGPTGAGKTTMVKLLMRFYDVNSGAIRVDDHDIRDLTRHDLRSMFGMVLQDAWLYNDTIMENIRYGRLDATDEEVIAAA